MRQDPGVRSSSGLGDASQIGLAADDPRVDRALFTLRESAACLDVPVSTLRLWARPGGAEPLLTTSRDRDVRIYGVYADGVGPLWQR